MFRWVPRSSTQAGIGYETDNYVPQKASLMKNFRHTNHHQPFGLLTTACKPKLGVLCFALLLVACTSSRLTATAQEPLSAETIQEGLRAIVDPTFDPDAYAQDPEYTEVFLMERTRANRDRVDLIKELWKRDPNNADALPFFALRWSLMSHVLDEPQVVLKEVAELLDDGSHLPLTQEAWFAHAQATIEFARHGNPDAKANVPTVVAIYLEKYPRNSRGAGLLIAWAKDYTKNDPLTRLDLYEQAARNYPDDRSAKYWPGKVAQIEGIDQPFHLNFTDALTGDIISTGDFVNQIIVVDFWATWCQPCLSKMPSLKALNTKYKDRGVAFIGISLDHPVENGGRDQLTGYCKQNMIDWPQFYQGQGWASAFSVSWGIDTLPTTFVIDQHGNLHTTSAQDDLEEVIERLLMREPNEGLAHSESR